MADFRKVNDRNLVVFGIPDVEVEREISNIYSELQRRPVAPDSAPPQIQAPVVSYTEPSAELVVNGLLTTPQIYLGSYVYWNTGFNSSFVIDGSNTLGSGAGALWFLGNSQYGFGSTSIGGGNGYRVISHNPSTSTTVLEAPNQPGAIIGYNITRGGAANKTLHALSGKLFTAEDPTTDNKFEMYDSSLPYMGTTVSSGQDYISLFSSTTSAPSNILVHGTITIGGVECIVAKDSGHVYSPSTDSWIGRILSPDGVTYVQYLMCKGNYMWCTHSGDLYSAASSLTPTWTLRNTDGIFFEQDNQADVSPTTGELVVIKDFGAGTTVRHGIDSYDFTTGVRTRRTGVFSATGLPNTNLQFAGTADVEPSIQNLSLQAGDGFVVVCGNIRSDALGKTIYESYLSPTNKQWVRAVWVLKGSGAGLESFATRITENDLDLWDDPNPLATVWKYHPYGSATISGSKVYTWMGGNLVQSAGLTDLTVRMESWIREHNI